MMSVDNLSQFGGNCHFFFRPARKQQILNEANHLWLELSKGPSWSVDFLLDSIGLNSILAQRHDAEKL